MANDQTTATTRTEESLRDRRLYRDMDNALLGGVLSGMAVYFRIDPVIVRVIFCGDCNRFVWLGFAGLWTAVVSHTACRETAGQNYTSSRQNRLQRAQS